MAELSFGCNGAHVVRNAATPTFALSLNITESTGVRLHAVALRCQVRIEPYRRRYTAEEARRLSELFGDTHSWGETAKPLQLATLTALVPGFTWRTEVELPVPCTYDLEVASARYLQVLEDGIIPLLLLFSGTVFVDHGHTYSVELIPWSLEVPFPMPVRVWRDVIEEHFPGSAWLRCSRETLGALAEFKSAYALSSWDATLSALLATASVPWDNSGYRYTAAGLPEGWDAAREQRVAATRFAAPELEVAAPEPQVAAAEPEVAAMEQEAATAEPDVAAPEPRAAAPGPEAGAPEQTDAAAADTAVEHTAPAPEDVPAAPTAAPPEPANTPPASADTPLEPANAVPAPRDAAPAEAGPVKRLTAARRRRTGTAGRAS